MSKNRLRFFDPWLIVCFSAFAIYFAFSAVIYLLYPTENYFFLLLIGAIILTLLFLGAIRASAKRRRELLKYIENAAFNIESPTSDSLTNFPLPLTVVRLENGEIIWSNENFETVCGEAKTRNSGKISRFIPGFDVRWVVEGKREYPGGVSVGSRHFRVYGSLIGQSGDISGLLASLFWVDDTDYVAISKKYTDSRPVCALIMLDNYDEIMKNISDKEKSSLLAMADEKISEWSAHTEGLLRKFDRDRYLFVFEERYLQNFVDSKLPLLDEVRKIVSSGGMPLTLSIGIGKDGKTLSEALKNAQLATDMALSRGGDQVVVRNKISFEFYGGRSIEFEKRTKVKSRVMANALSELIKDSSMVFIMGHRVGDLDSLGSAVGIVCIARKLSKKVKIALDIGRSSARAMITRLSELPEYDGIFCGIDEAILTSDADALLVVVDTNRPEYVEFPELLSSLNRVAVIDHHRRGAEYIARAALNFHEPYASSTSEMITELLQYIVEIKDINRIEAEALLAGIALDTKNFTLKTGVRTFEAAAFLRRVGANTLDVKRIFQSNLDDYLKRSDVVRRAVIYREYIAIAVVDLKLDRPVAASAADELLNITGVQASFVIFRTDEDISISARSLGNINVQLLLEDIGGGGHITTAGAQIKGRQINEIREMLMRAIDKYLEQESKNR